MSQTTLTPSAQAVTTRDSKGRKFLEVVEAAYNKALLTEAEAQRVNEAGGLADLIAHHIKRHRFEIPPLLKLITKVAAAGTKKFVADKATLKETNIRYAWDNFTQFFPGKVEENVADATLAIYHLQKDSLDGLIRKELGQEREEITLTHFFALLKQQSRGEEGPLLVNGYVNIAYIKDKNGQLWAVHADWRSDSRYWHVSAYSVEDPREWNAGNQVISRDS